VSLVATDHNGPASLTLRGRNIWSGVGANCAQTETSGRDGLWETATSGRVVRRRPAAMFRTSGHDKQRSQRPLQLSISAVDSARGRWRHGFASWPP